MLDPGTQILHFKDEETEAQRGKEIPPRLHSMLVAEADRHIPPPPRPPPLRPTPTAADQVCDFQFRVLSTPIYIDRHSLAAIH